MEKVILRLPKGLYAAAIIALLVCNISFAASLYYTGGDWDDPTSWSPEGVPDSSDSAYIANYDTAGSLELSDSAEFSTMNGYIGKDADKDGSVIVDGAGSSWDVINKLVVGDEGYGELTVSNGATISSDTGLIGGYIETDLRSGFPIVIVPDTRPNGTGLVNIDGENSCWTVGSTLLVGEYGDGELNITNGGHVSGDLVRIDGGYVELGDAVFAQGEGSVTVDGEGSSLTANDMLTVGTTQNGTGTLNVTNGGEVACDRAYVGGFGLTYSGTGKIIVKNSGSSLTVNKELYLTGKSDSDNSFAHLDSLIVAKGASVSCGNATIASSKVTVKGVGTTWDVNGEIDIRNGDLVIKNSGLVQSDQLTLSNRDTWYDDGVLVYLDGGTIKTNTMTNLCAIGAFSFTSGDLHTDNYIGKLEINGGTLCPGNSSKLMNITEKFKMSSGTIQIEIAGLTRGVEYSSIDTETHFNLDGGNLDVELADGFELDYNQLFTIIDVGGDLAGTGQFDGLGQDSLVGSFNGVDLFISYTAGDGNDIALYTAIPEPGTLLLVGVGGLILRRAKLRL